MISTPERDAVTLHYQPWATRGGQVVGLEALMRWHHQQRGAISPEAFIPVFERNGLMLPLSCWALKQACNDAASWQRPLAVAVNLSPLQFAHQDLVEVVASILGTTGLPAGRLQLEMNETALLADAGHTRMTLVALARLGVKIVLDDFGIGESAPSYLKDYPFSQLKIDPSFVKEIEHSASARWILHTLIELGHSLHLPVASEGVETPRQRAFLIEEGCDLIQGSLIGRPGRIEEFTEITGCLIAAQSPATMWSEVWPVALLPPVQGARNMVRPAL